VSCTTFRNDGDGPVRLLNFNTPAGFENYMRDLAEAAHSGPLTPEVIAPSRRSTTASSRANSVALPLRGKSGVRRE
jgi:hypothetical protein